MISSNLDPLKVEFVQEIKNTFIYGKVPHLVEITADIRVRFGVKIAGSCKRTGRKTCGFSGSSEGVNDISVSLAASDIAAVTIAGKDYLEFTLFVEVEDENVGNTYPPITAEVQ